MTVIDLKFETLVIINGISPKRQQYLREGLGIQTFSQLVEATPESIKAYLKEKKHYVSLSDVKEWQKKAEELATTFKVKAKPASGGILTEKSGWNAFATYVVEFQECVTDKGREFQTQVHHMEGGYNGGGRGDKWKGLAVKKAGQWIETDALELVSEIEEITPEEIEEPKPTAPVTPPLTVEITQIQAYQPLDATKPTGKALANQLFIGFIEGDKPFALELNVRLGQNGNVVATHGPITYQAQAFAYNRTTGENIQLCEPENSTFSEGQTEDNIKLPVSSLSPGYYRLQAMMTLQTKPQALGFLEVPLLQVS